MKEYIKRLLDKWSCKRKWELHFTIEIYDPLSFSKRPINIKETLICNNCGKIKQIDL